jgi:hypothetical protein
MGNQFYLPSSLPSTVPGGIETQYQIRDLVMNNKNDIYNIYRVTEVSGLEDADFRDSREPNPARDGEVAYPAFYSGRTVVLSGVIHAGNYAKMRSMLYDLQTATNPLTEEALLLNHYNLVENFSPVSTFYNDFMVDAGNINNISIANGHMTGAINYSTENRFIYNTNERIFGDHAIQLKVTFGNDTADFQAGVIFRRKSDDTYLHFLLKFFNSYSGYEFAKYIGGVKTVINSAYGAPYSWTQGGEAWFIVEVYDEGRAVRWRLSTDKINPDYLNLSAILPNLTTAPHGYADGTFDGTGQVGITFTPGDSQSSIDDFRVYSFYPYDVYLPVRKSQPLMVKESQTNNKYERPFQVSFRSSHPFFLSQFWHHMIADGNPWSGASLPYSTRLYRTYDKIYNYEYEQYIDVFGELTNASGNTVYCYNYGNYVTFPEISLQRISGSAPITAINIINHTTEDTLRFVGTNIIAVDEKWLIDCHNRVLTDIAGVSKFSYVDPTSKWISLIPGPNYVEYQYESTSTAAFSMSVDWQSAWI